MFTLINNLINGKVKDCKKIDHKTTNGTKVKNVDLLKTIVRRIQDYPNLVVETGSVDQHTKSLASQELTLNLISK